MRVSVLCRCCKIGARRTRAGIKERAGLCHRRRGAEVARVVVHRDEVRRCDEYVAW